MKTRVIIREGIVTGTGVDETEIMTEIIPQGKGIKGQGQGQGLDLNLGREVIDLVERKSQSHDHRLDPGLGHGPNTMTEIESGLEGERKKNERRESTRRQGR